MKKLNLALLLSLLWTLLMSSPAMAVSSSNKSFSYDVSGSVGSYNGNSYTEIHVGLNWFVTDWLNWRNSVFSQFGSNLNSVYGLDSTALFNTEVYNSDRTAGVELYAGPGVRLASEKSNAVLGTAGLTVALGGLRVGGGATYLSYFEDRDDKLGTVLPRDEVQYFIVLSGGGSF